MELLGDLVAVRPVSAEEKRGELLVARDGDRPREGEVVFVGRDCREVEAGQVVAFSPFATLPLPEVEGEADLLVLREPDIYASKEAT